MFYTFDGKMVNVVENAECFQGLGHTLKGKLLFPFLSGIFHAYCLVLAAGCVPGWCSAELVTETQTSHPQPRSHQPQHLGGISFVSGGGSRRRCQVNILWRCIHNGGTLHRKPRRPGVSQAIPAPGPRLGSYRILESRHGAASPRRLALVLELGGVSARVA